MGIYFGTDGIRGIYGKDMTPLLAYKLGCTLSNFCENKKVLIGRDTRLSGQVLSLSVCNGLAACGIDVVDVGIAPTPVISFLTPLLKCDFGIVVSASHNPPEYNGIKIFDKFGYKITEKKELEIEDNFMCSNFANFDSVGTYKFQPSYLKLYTKKVLKNFETFDGLKIVVDCANGATYKIAKELLSKLCKNAIFLSCKDDGNRINENCGALHPENISKNVLKYNADIGFAFDGDGDRIIACDKLGNILDGDDILCLLSKQLGKNEKYIVGTTMTNKGLENHLSKNHITLLRADVGDKYVAELMRDKNILLGGEPSGHIIIKSYSKTGDGIMVACLLSSIIAKNNISSLLKYKKYPQTNINVPVQDKFRVLNSDILSKEILSIQKEIKNNGRMLVRASGTENKIRIMCEHISKEKSTKYARRLQNIIEKINSLHGDD